MRLLEAADGSSANTSSGGGGSPAYLRKSRSSVVMYASPNAVVTAAAVVAETTPPTMEPTPGISLSKLLTMERPVIVAIDVPTVLATSVVRKPSENDRP